MKLNEYLGNASKLLQRVPPVDSFSALCDFFSIFFLSKGSPLGFYSSLRYSADLRRSRLVRKCSETFPSANGRSCLKTLRNIDIDRSIIASTKLRHLTKSSTTNVMVSAVAFSTIFKSTSLNVEGVSSNPIKRAHYSFC